jgi:methylglutaconyl-CoA hydratase
MSEAPDPVLLDVSPEGVAIVTLNRPAKRNAFDEILIAGLADAFETLHGADHVRIVFLRGNGEAFSAGADLDWMRRQGEHLKQDNELDALNMAKMLKALHDLPQFTVSLVHGFAMGGGIGLAAATDYTVATKGAQFRFSEVRLGLTPATISPYIVEAIGPRAARGLFASALPFNAMRAKEIGLVQDIVDDEAGLDAAMKKLAGLAFENAPGAVADSKQLVRDVTGHPIDKRIGELTAKRIAERRASDEGKEGVGAFLARRKPGWDVGQS